MKSLCRIVTSSRVCIVYSSLHLPRRYIFKASYNMASKSNAELHPCRVAVTQMTAVSDKEKNLATCENLVKKAAIAGAKMVFLPEACDYIAESKEDSIRMAESIDGPLVTKFCDMASSLGVWLSLGGLHIKEKSEDKVSNTHILIDDNGTIISTYKKTHLFSVHIPEKNLRLEESTYIAKGEGIYPPVSTPAGKVALAICYDMRFPELSLIQRRHGAQILTFPSAFTVTTGLAHWEAILRGRAIETQCYVVAAAQTGQHNQKRSSYGHALIVDPWGKVVCEIEDGTDIALADIDLNYLEKIRKDMPVISHRRSDLYQLFEIPQCERHRVCSLLPMPSPYVSFVFGSVSIPGSCIFLKSFHSQSFVNKKPVVPGHVLVTPERPAKRYCDLTSSEICDLVQLLQLTCEVIIKEHQPESFQVGLQDGQAAGQTIEHVHFHVVPMNATLRQKLQGHERHIKWRDTHEMVEETNRLRQIVSDNHCNFYNRPSVVFEPFEVVQPHHNQDIDHLHIPEDLLISRTKYSCSFVPPEAVIHGHICVALTTSNVMLRDAPAHILTDLFLLVQLMQKNVEDLFNTKSSTVFILENLQADENQILQVHIIPRKDGDFPVNDDIYGAVKNFELHSTSWSPSKESLSLARNLKNIIFKDLSGL